MEQKRVLFHINFNTEVALPLLTLPNKLCWVLDCQSYAEK